MCRVQLPEVRVPKDSKGEVETKTQPGRISAWLISVLKWGESK